MTEHEKRSPGKLFPMRLTSIEKFHFFDDSQEFPNNLFCRIRLEGKVDRDKALEAIRFFESRHPLLNTIVQQRGNRLVWDGHLPPSQTIRWADFSQPPGFERLDLQQRPGVQLLFRVGENETEIWVHAHHATLDGGAGIQIANEWLAAYANLVAGQPVEQGIPRLDRDLLLKRSSLNLLSWSYLQHLYKQPIALFGASKFLFRKFGLLTQSIFHRSAPVVLHDAFPTILSRWIEPDVVDSLRAQAKQHGVMLNTVLLAHLYITIWHWRTKHQFGRPDDWLRILMPMSIRGMGDRRLSATNRSAVVQIDRRPADFENTQQLLQGLDREVGIIRNWHLNKMFLIAIRTMSVFPGWLRSSAENDKYRGTIIFTNLGTPFSRNRRLKSSEGIVAGNLKLVEFDWVGPIRKGIGVNVSVQQHDNRMRLSMHVDPRQVDVPVAEELFDAYVDRLENYPF